MPLIPLISLFPFLPPHPTLILASPSSPQDVVGRNGEGGGAEDDDGRIVVSHATAWYFRLGMYKLR